jgi:hypothetical protein
MDVVTVVYNTIEIANFAADPNEQKVITFCSYS